MDRLLESFFNFVFILFPYLTLKSLKPIFRIVLEVSLSMALIIALLLLLRPLLQKRYRAKWMYWVWLVVAVRLILPVNFSLPGAPVQVASPAMVLYRTEGNAPPSWRWAEADALATVNLEEIKPLLGVGEDLYDRVITPMKPVLTLAQLAALVWGAGVCALLLWEAISYARFRRRIKRWRSAEQDPEVLAQFEALKTELGVKKLTLARCSAISSPMVTGFVHPALLLPTDFLCHSEGQRPEEPCPGERILRCAQDDSGITAVLRHELVHAKRRDLWYKLLLVLVRAVHWFNPLAWMLARTASLDLEISCDETAVVGMDAENRAGYGKAILAAMDAALPPERAPLTTYFHGGKAAMLERLKSIVNTKAKGRGAVALTLAAALTLTVSAAVAVTPATRRVDGGIYGVTVPADMTVKLTEEMPEGFVTSYDKAELYRDGALGTIRAFSVPGFDRMTAEERAQALSDTARYQLFHSSYDEYVSPGGLEGVVADGGSNYYLSTGGNQVLSISFYFGPKFDDFMEGSFTRAEAEALLASLRVGSYLSPAPVGGLTLTTNFTETGALWYLWGGTDHAPMLLDTVSIPALHPVVGSPLWSPDGKWAVVPASSEGGIRQDFLVLGVGKEGFTQKISTLFSLGGDSASLFASSGAPLDYVPIRETLALQVVEFVENPFSRGDLPAVRVDYAWMDTAGKLQSGTFTYPCVPLELSSVPAGYTPLTDIVQTAPCVPTVWQDGAHTLSLLLPAGTVISGENQGIRTFTGSDGAYLGRIHKVARADAWSQAYEVATQTHFYAWLDEADGLCYQLELRDTNPPLSLANRMVEALTMDGSAVDLYYENQIANPTA